MSSGDRQRRDGSGKRAHLTTGDHAGNLYGPKHPKGKRGKPVKQARTVPPDPGQRIRQWQELFDRLKDVKRREAERRRGRPET